jgi:hypothetical protein
MESTIPLTIPSHFIYLKEPRIQCVGIYQQKKHTVAGFVSKEYFYFQNINSVHVVDQEKKSLMERSNF